VPILLEKSKTSFKITYIDALALNKSFMRILLFSESTASTEAPPPRPFKRIFLGFKIAILSFFDKLKIIVLFTPVSKIKESVFQLTSTGITIKLLINLKETLCFDFDFF
jgi:hypothetical protein